MVNSEKATLKSIAVRLSTVALGMTLAAPLGNADVKPQSVPPPFKIEKLWMLTYIGNDGVETIVQANSPSGGLVPLMAVDQQRLESIIELGKQVSGVHNVNLTLVEFSNRLDAGEIKPLESQPAQHP